ncbi:hypothetical protein [Janibacter sp. G56]|uniref:hypothetical protein n=1 Tax=Janibacter sp. G56 TaxID=3418717 RepID=UPI003D060FFB
MIAAQVLIPLMALVGFEDPTRLGFQMYAGPGAVTATAVAADGAEREIDLREQVVHPRPELDWSGLADALCERLPDAASVRVEQRFITRTATWTARCP